MTLAVGDVVPDFTFLRADGTPWRLSKMTTRPLLLIFLRHLG